MPPLQPMLAKAASSVPAQPESGPVWLYEPKWDGFRTLVFRDGDEVVLGSRGGKDLARYFPELVRAVKDELPERCVVDGELVVPRNIDGRTRLDWESLSERIHPAESRVTMLAEKTPAQFVAFDLLALGDRDLSREDFSVRRAQLVDSVGGGSSATSPRPPNPVRRPPSGSRRSRGPASTGWWRRSWWARTCRTSGRW